MKTIKGICIKKRNFDKFKKVADLIYFDGPLLSHYVTNKGDNYLLPRCYKQSLDVHQNRLRQYTKVHE